MEMYGETPKKFATFYSRLLLLISLLFQAKKLNEQEKNRLKNLTLQKDERMIAALQTYEVDKNLDELTDTLKRICSVSSQPTTTTATTTATTSASTSAPTPTTTTTTTSNTSNTQTIATKSKKKKHQN